MSAPVAEPQPQRDQPTTEQAVLGALAVVLLSEARPEIVSAHVLPLLADLGVPPAAGMAALSLLLPHPVVGADRIVGRSAGDPAPGPAQAWNAGTTITRRVEYLVAAAKRLADPAHPTARERAHLQAHLRAQQARAAAAVKVDRAARLHGPELGWHAILDARTTPECRAAHGSNFRAGEPPRIGYPGTLHGGTCRCLPGAPFREALPVDEAVERGLDRLTGRADIAFSRRGRLRSVLSRAHPWK